MIPLFKVHMPPNLAGPLLETLYSGYVAEGRKVELFERAFGTYVHNTRVLALNSGTSALTLALRLAGVEYGDCVVTTPMTCTATNLPILSLGAKPLWADVDAVSGQISPHFVERHFTRSRGRLPKAIVCVDWGGAPCDMDALRSIGERWGVPVIEDAAHALGATYRGVPVGAVADYTCFSLQAIKHITTGDGGVLACLRAEDHERARRLRWFGIDRGAPTGDSRIDVDIEEWGYKFHMNDVAATIGIEQMRYLSGIISSHRENAAYYDATLSRYFVRAYHVQGTVSARWLYTVLLPNSSERDAFVRFMLGRGIQVSRVHRPNDEYSVFKPYNFMGSDLTGTRVFSSRMVCIPVHWALTADERQQVADACDAWVNGGQGA